MTDKVQKIREEVERLKESGCASHIVICDTLLAFIDSLQEESVSEELEEVAGNYAMNELNVFGNQDGWTENGAVYDMIKATARHFTNWQKQQIIGKACEWVRTHRDDDFFELVPEYNYCGAGNLNIDKMVEEYRKYLEE